jgi:hypothetical protein
MTYTTETTMRGEETYLLLGMVTVAIFVGDDHVETAAEVAELLNKQSSVAEETANTN